MRSEEMLWWCLMPLVKVADPSRLVGFWHKVNSVVETCPYPCAMISTLVDYIYVSQVDLWSDLHGKKDLGRISRQRGEEYIWKFNFCLSYPFILDYCCH